MQIVKVTIENYDLFDDMVYRRMNGRDREEGEGQRFDRDAIGKTLLDPNLYVYAAKEDGGQFVGWISLVYLPKVGRHAGRGLVYVDEVYVEPAYRSHGVGGELMKAADEVCSSRQATGIRLYVSQDNEAAICTYRKSGFQMGNTAHCMEKVKNP